MEGVAQLVVFICSPYGGDIEVNTMRAKRYGRFAVAQGVTPVIPHLMYPQFLDENSPDERKQGLAMGLVLLERCDAIWIFGDHLSSGMTAEIASANKLGLPKIYFNTQCREIGRG